MPALAELPGFDRLSGSDDVLSGSDEEMSELAFSEEFVSFSDEIVSSIIVSVNGLTFIVSVFIITNLLQNANVCLVIPFSLCYNSEK